MRKYILAIILILIGSFLLIYVYLQKNKSNYSETLFSQESKIFEKNFTQFVGRVKGNVDTLKINYKDSTRIKDTLYTRNFFMNLINADDLLNSVVFIQNNYKAAIVKEGKSVLFVIDSSKNQEIVRWQRFENKKLISSWKESFERPVNKSKWFKNLNKHKDQIKWLFDVYEDDGSKNDQFLYAGYSNEANNVKNTLLLQYSRETILDKLQLKYSNSKIRIESLLGNLLNFEMQDFNKSIQNKSFIDSLNINIKTHFLKFKNDMDGTFNFSFKNEVYWNSFKRFPFETGILYYLLTIPNKDLQIIKKSPAKEIMKWVSIISIIVGLLILLVKKRFFYIPNRINIASVNEILQEDENRYLEFKSSMRWDYRQEKTNPELEKVILKTLAAFGNTDGGILLIGVDDDKNIIGLENDFNTLKKSNSDFYEIHLRNILHNLMGVKYVSKYIRTQFETCENGKEICKIKVIAASEPLYLKYKNKNGQIEEKFYVRSGNSSQEIKSIAEINDYINSRFK